MIIICETEQGLSISEVSRWLKIGAVDSVGWITGAGDDLD